MKRLASWLLLAIAICSPAFAGLHGHVRQVSPRSMLNVGLYGTFDYAYINFLQEADAFLSPIGLNFSTGTCYWNSALLDSNGYPNTACANGLSFGGGYRMPSQTQFSGQYSFDGSGLGVIALNLQLVVQSGVSCGGVASGVAPNNTGSGWGYTSVSAAGGIVTNDTAGTGFCVPFVLNASNTTPGQYTLAVQNTCSTTSGACVGAFIKGLRLYQQADYTRLAAGKIFRNGFLQPIATQDPSAIRFMQWGSGNGLTAEIRYENRTKATTTSGNTGSYWLASPPYTVSSGTNLISVAAAAGTPVAMTHGEVATFRVGGTMPASSCNSIGCARPTVITNASPGAVTTNIAHGFTTGDVVIHKFAGATMPNLNLYPVCVTVSDATHYTMQVFTVATNTCTATNVNTTSWGAFVPNGSDTASEYVSLNVGARLNAPLVTADGISPAQTTGYLAVAGGYLLDLVYDKNSCAITDGASNPICGAWLTSGSTPLPSGAGVVFGFEAATPIEFQVEFINEVNALLTGGQHPIALWVTLPYIAMVPSDPDYSTASDYPLNAAKTIINGTYPLCAGCTAIIENDNEWWNFGYSSWGYYNRQSVLRFGAANGGSSYFGTLRSVQMFEDIHNNSGVYNPSVFRFAMMSGPWTAVGDPNSAGSGGYIRLFGDPIVMNDARWPNPNSPPYAYFDAFGYAPYVAAPAGFYTANFATMQAAWCTAQAAACAATPPYAPNCTGAVDAAYCAPFVAAIAGPLANPVGSDLTTIADQIFGDELFKKAAYKVGKSFIQYEGGTNWQTATNANMPNGVNISTLGNSNYLVALYQSQSWANAWANYCKLKTYDTSAGGCGNLREVQVPQSGNFIWSFTSPDAFGSTLTEGGGLIPEWNSLTTVNSGQP